MNGKLWYLVIFHLTQHELTIFYFSAVFYRICAVSNLSELLWVVGINDFVLKFTSVIVKIGIIFVPSHMLQHRKRVIEID